MFIRGGVSVNEYLNEGGVKFFNSDDIEDLDFSNFITFEEKETNYKNVQK